MPLNKETKPNLLSPSLLYIYIYIERERERENGSKIDGILFFFFALVEARA